MRPRIKVLIGVVLSVAIAAAAYFVGERQQLESTNRFRANYDRQLQVTMQEFDTGDALRKERDELLAENKKLIELSRRAVDECGELRSRLLAAEREKTSLELQLPHDNDKWYTTLFLHPHPEQLDAQREKTQLDALALWERADWLQDLKRQTHPRVIRHDEPEFRPYAGDATHAPVVEKTPCLLIQRANGQVIYREYGSALGKLPLKYEVQKACRRHCPHGRCNPPAPPAPAPAPNAPVAAQPQREVPAALAKHEHFPALTLLLTLAAAAATFYVKLVA